MPSWPIHTRSVSRYALAGLVLGLIGAYALRYLTLRRVTVANPPTINPGDKGFLFTFDYLQYVSGPDWWPTIVALPLIGLAVGALVGVLLSQIKSGYRPSIKLSTIYQFLGAVVVGAAVGGLTALYQKIEPATIRVSAVADPGYAYPANGPQPNPVHGAPWNYVVEPGPVLFILIGALIAVLVVLAIDGVFFTARLGRRILDQRDT